MKDYSGWKEKNALVTSLQLDPQNPRMPPGPAALGQRELARELVEHDSVYDLAKDIAEKGYWPIESLIGFDDVDGRSYVLEGNRRLAALKLLINPDLAPEKYLRRFRNLAATIDTDKLKRVRVLYAPTREAAAPIIMQKHTGKQVEGWSPVMQARFYRGLVQEGVPLDVLAKEYGVTAGDISKRLRLDTMYAIAYKLTLPEDVATIVRDPRNFSATTLERIIDAPKAREFLGIEFDSLGKVQGKIDAKEFQKAYARILTDIATSKVDSRALNRAEDLEQYLQKFGSDAPQKGSAGLVGSSASFTDEDLTAAPAKPPAAPAKPAAKPAKAKSAARAASVLVPKGFVCSVSNNRIQEIFGELRRLKIDEFPNACGILLRVLLDLSVGHYMQQTGRIQPLLDKARQDQKKPTDWFPTLNMMLAAMAGDKTIPLVPLAQKRLNKLVSDKTSYFSVNLLDGFAHSPFELPTPRELRTLWDTFEGIFELTLRDHPPAAGHSGAPKNAAVKPPKKV